MDLGSILGAVLGGGNTRSAQGGIDIANVVKELGNSKNQEVIKEVVTKVTGNSGSGEVLGNVLKQVSNSGVLNNISTTDIANIANNAATVLKSVLGK